MEENVHVSAIPSGGFPLPDEMCQLLISCLQFSSYNMKRCCFSSHAMVENVESGLVDVPLAQTGEGIAECELLRWFVQEVSEDCKLNF